MAVRLFTRRQIIETARVKAEKLVTNDALALLQKGWTTLRPSIESLKKADGDIDAMFDTWSTEFDKEFNDMLLRAAGIMGDAEVSYWERRARAGVIYSAQTIVDGRSEIIGRRTGKEIKSVPDATRDFVSAAVRSWYDSDESMASLVERMSSYFQPWRAQRIAITEVTALASSVADNMMSQLGIDTWTWDSRNDMIVCPLCGSLHGNRFTRKDPMPPRHPECRCGTSILDKDLNLFAMPDFKKVFIQKHLPGKHNQKDHAPGHPAVEGQNEYLDSLSTDQLKAIRRYTGGGFTFMNKHLRQGTPTSEENKRKIEVLKGVINNSPPFKHDVELSRFMLRPPNELGMKVGSTFHDKGFTSTTLGKHDYGKWNPEVAMTIHARAGQHGLHVKEVSGHESENEVILPPGSRFRVTKMTEVVAGKWKVEVELEQ